MTITQTAKPMTSAERDHPRSVRIAVADDHPIFRDGLKRLLESEPGFRVVAEAADGVDAIRVARDAKPDILLLDVAMPRMSGVEAMSTPDLGAVRVILLTASIEPAELLRAVQFGARGVLLKESGTRDLIEGIHRVMDGRLLIGAEIAADLAQAVRQASLPTERPYGLSSREVEIIEAIVAGDSNREIAVKLDISLQTVKHHLTSAFAKTGTSTRLGLAMLAISHRIVDA